MKKINIFQKLPENLGSFKDERGLIVDLFYKASINHVALIESIPGAIRGNHYHALSTQHIFILDGSLEYWYKQNNDDKIGFELCVVGDLVTSDENEIHALKIGSSGCRFMALTEGVRGGEDYESDTFRVPNIIGKL